MRYFTGFLIVLCSVVFWLLPVSDAIYSFKTDLRTDSFLVTTAAGVTSNNSTLVKPLYADDVSTLSFSSNCTNDNIAYTSYNATAKRLLYHGLEAGKTRLVEISYDASAFDFGGPYNTLTDAASWLMFIFFIIFPMGGIYVAFKPDLENIFA